MRFEEEKFVFDSANGIYKVCGKIMKPLNTEVKGIIQISHGMCEYIDKYDDFSEFFLEKGYAVVGNDHMGHGESINTMDDRGFFGSRDGYKFFMEDLKKVTDIAKEKYPEKPIYLLGHSMGSLIARCYAAKYGNELAGLILCGTVGPQPLAKAGIKFADLLANQKGEKYRSRKLYNISLDCMNIKFLPMKTRFDWVSTDKNEVEKHLNDERASFIFTVKGFSDLFHLVILANSEMLIKTIPKDLNILFMSGDEDPVGENGYGVKRAFELYKKQGLSNTEIKLYHKRRHELLKEIDKEKIYKDVFEWIQKSSQK